MKLIVKTSLDPELKEVFEGTDLKVSRTNSRGAAMRDVLLIKDKDAKILGEFDHFLYWRYVDAPDKDRLQLMQAAVLGKIQAILDDGQVKDDIRMEKIQKLMYEEGQLELIREPDKDLLLLNLEYLGTVVDGLTPGMDTETLAWCMYAVKQFAENNLVPGGPADPDSSDWTWEQFKTSFRAATPVVET